MIKYEDSEKYPYSIECYCGNKAHLKYNKVVAREKDKKIVISNVPVYECISQHVSLTRRTQVKVAKVIREKEPEMLGKIYTKISIE